MITYKMTTRPRGSRCAAGGCGCFISTETFLRNVAGSMSLCTIRALGTNWGNLPVTRSSKRAPTAQMTSAWVTARFAAMVKIQMVSPVFRRYVPCLGLFIGYSFGISRNKASTISYGTAFGKVYFVSQLDIIYRNYLTIFSVHKKIVSIVLNSCM